MHAKTLNLVAGTGPEGTAGRIFWSLQICELCSPESNETNALLVVRTVYSHPHAICATKTQLGSSTNLNFENLVTNQHVQVEGNVCLFIYVTQTTI